MAILLGSQHLGLQWRGGRAGFCAVNRALWDGNPIDMSGLDLNIDNIMYISVPIYGYGLGDCLV